MTTPEIEDLINRLIIFVHANRGSFKNKPFYDWTYDEMADSFREAILNKSLLYFTNEVGTITGMVHGVADDKRKLFHVTNVLVTDTGIFPRFVARFDELFPGYKLQGHRYGKLKQYDTLRFRNKILKVN